MVDNNSLSGRQIAGVTGASSGIGYALAKQFAEHGYDLVIVAEDDGIDRAATELRQLGGSVRAVRSDLTTREGVEEFVAALSDAGDLDAIAINAGIGNGGEFAQTDLEQDLDLVDLNCRSVVHLAKRAIEMMKPRGRGKILFTASIAALAPGPYEAVYSASKAFDYYFAMALHQELKDSGITVTALMPGPTDTNFFDRAHMQDTKLGEGPKDDPDLVAKHGFDALMKGKDHVIAGSLKTRARGSVMGVIPDKVATALHSQEAKPKSS